MNERDAANPVDTSPAGTDGPEAASADASRHLTEEIHTSDPDRIRALAHPLRLQLIDLVQDHGEITASECAERLGQTVANCSFHLRVLERAGFVERAEQRGREKPWRSSSRRRHLEPDPESPASVLALAELITATLAHISNRFTNYLREHAAQDDPAWRDATLLDQSSFWATAEEAAEVRDALGKAAAPFLERRRDPSQRPEGARLIRLTSLIHPDLSDTTE